MYIVEWLEWSVVLYRIPCSVFGRLWRWCRHTPLILYKLPEALVFQNGFSYRQTVSLIPTEQQNLKRKGTERKCKKSERKKRKVYFYSRFVVLILFISNSSRVAASNCEWSCWRGWSPSLSGWLYICSSLHFFCTVGSIPRMDNVVKRTQEEEEQYGGEEWLRQTYFGFSNVYIWIYCFQQCYT